MAWRYKGELKYALEGSIFVSGSLIQWLRDGLKLFSNAKDSERIAKEVEDSSGIIVVPSFTVLGAPYWVKECKGAIYGITRGSDYRHIVRASLEALAYQSKDLVEVMQADMGKMIKELKVDGGASSNNFLLQFQSDILGIEVTRVKMLESTALGAARLAGLETGFYSFDDFKDNEVDSFKPLMEENKRNRLYRRWKKAIEATVAFKDEDE